MVVISSTYHNEGAGLAALRVLVALALVDEPPRLAQRQHRLHVAAQLGVGDAGRGQTVVEVLDAEGDALAPLRQHVAALDGVHGGEEEAGLEEKGK